MKMTIVTSMAKDESTDDHGDDDADGRHGRQHYHDAQKLTVILPKTMHQTHRLILIVSTIIIFMAILQVTSICSKA